MYQKNTETGYIVSVVNGVTVGNITEEEYKEILEGIRNNQTAPEGYDHKLKEDLSWELYELPAPETEPEYEEVTEEDYKSTLNTQGVSIE